MRIFRGWNAKRSVPSPASKRPSLSAPLPTSLSIAPVTAPSAPRARTRVKAPVPGAIPSAVAVQRQTPVSASAGAAAGSAGEASGSAGTSSGSASAAGGAGSSFRLHRSCQVSPPSSVRQTAPSSVPTQSRSGSKRDSARAVADPRSVAVITPEIEREDSPRWMERNTRLPAL